MFQLFRLETLHFQQRFPHILPNNSVLVRLGTLGTLCIWYTSTAVSVMAASSCRCGRLWWRRKSRTKYRGPWWRWPAVSIFVTYSEVHDWVSVDKDDAQRSDTTPCHVTRRARLVGTDQLCYNSDSSLYSKMPVGM